MMKFRLFAHLVCASIILNSVPVFAHQTKNIIPYEDTYTFDLAPDNCFALESEIIVGKSEDEFYAGYVTFALPSDVNSDEKILLELNTQKGESDSLGILGCSEQDLISADITYNSAPANGSTLALCKVSPNEKTTVDVTEYVLKNISDRRNISFCLMSDRLLKKQVQRMC